jgi:hypothetical protein
LQTPPEHASEVVHWLASSHAALIGVATHAPPTQLSAVQGFWSSQTTFMPTQAPPAQTSPLVQGLPSEQAAVFAKARHAPPTHASSVQGFPSSQTSF